MQPIVQINHPQFKLKEIRGRVITVFNPKNGKYGIALATKGKRLGLNDKAQAEETLKKLNSLFD